MKQVLINLNGNSPAYLLLGEDACREYDENGIDGVLYQNDDNGMQYGTYLIDDGESLFSLLEAMAGWNDYCVITAEEYALL